MDSNTFVKPDGMGNMLIIIIHVEDGKKCSAEVYLRLRNTARRRKLGVIHYGQKEGDTFMVKRTPSSHFHYRANGYGFNDEVLREQQMFNIGIIDLIEKDGLRYRFPKSIITNYGRYFHFKTEGYEVQRFININLLKPFKIERNDKQKNDSGRGTTNVVGDTGWRADD